MKAISSPSLSENPVELTKKHNDSEKTNTAYSSSNQTTDRTNHHQNGKNFYSLHFLYSY